MKASQYKAQYDKLLRQVTEKYGDPRRASDAEKNRAEQLFRAYQRAAWNEHQAKRR